MKKTFSKLFGAAALIGILGFSAVASAAEVNPVLEKAGVNIEGNLNIANDVMFRGVSITKREPGIQGNVRLVLPSKVGSFYTDVDAKSTTFNPLMTYSVGYENSVKYFKDAKLYGNIEYKIYQFQTRDNGWEKSDLDFTTVYVKLGLEDVAIDSLNFYVSGEFVDNENATKDFNTKDRYGVLADYTFDTFAGNIQVGGQFFDQHKWGKDCQVFVSNRIYENTDLKVAYNRFKPDMDTQSYVTEDTNTYIVSLNYQF
jgi:uncharacterized protein (TIGR02001 family)